MNVELITTGAGLEALRHDWSELWEASEATVFQTPDWLVPWWNHVAEGELLTIVVRDGRRLVGLVPLYVWTRPDDGARVLFLLGVATTDRLDGLFAPGWEERAVQAAFARLDALRDRWDVADLQQLRPGAALLGVEVPAGWTSRVEPGEACTALAPPTIPWKMRKNLRYYRNRAAREGAIRYERADDRTLEGLWDTFVGLHRRRWDPSGATAMAPELATAQRETMPALIRRHALRLWILSVDRRPVAGIYALADRRVHRLYLMAFDPAFEALSPGTLIIGHAVDEAVREGATLVDFLRGGEAYKQIWGVTERPLYRRRLAWSEPVPG